MTMTTVDHWWSLTFLTFVLTTFSNATPINRQVGISENVFITVQNDTYGIEQRVCSIDSMTYGDGETIPTSSPCEHCICRPPGFACTIISCEYRPGCKAFKRSNQCCPEYQCECEKDGKIYQNGEKIMDSNNPCEICYCQGGEIVCAVIDCYWRSDCQPRYIENRCCPLYDHCPPPANAGPFARPTIPTTTTASGFPWFNLSSAVYEVPEVSSPTPVPVVPTSTEPTTTPVPPELVVIATQKAPIEVHILATAQEESSPVDVNAIPPDSQSELVDVQKEGHINTQPFVSLVDAVPSEAPVLEVIQSSPEQTNISDAGAAAPVPIVVVQPELDVGQSLTVAPEAVEVITPTPQEHAKESTTLFMAPAIAISIIPSPVEEILVSQEAPAMVPEVMEKNETQHPDPVSQSEMAVSADQEQVLPTDAIQHIVQSAEIEVIPTTPISVSNNAAEDEAVTLVEFETSVTFGYDEGHGDNFLSHEAVQAAKEPEVATTSAPAVVQEENSISSDDIRVPEKEVVEVLASIDEQEKNTLTPNTVPEVDKTEPPVVQPVVPSIATIIMPPPKENQKETVPVIPVQNTDVATPSVELQPPAHEFVNEKVQSQPESTTSFPEISDAETPEKFSVTGDISQISQEQPTRSPPVNHGYLPVHNQEIVTGDAVTTPQVLTVVESESSTQQPTMDDPIVEAEHQNTETDIVATEVQRITTASPPVEEVTVLSHMADENVESHSNSDEKDSIPEGVVAQSDQPVVSESPVVPSQQSELESTTLPVSVGVSDEPAPAIETVADHKVHEITESAKKEEAIVDDAHVILAETTVPLSPVGNDHPKNVINVIDDNTFEIIPPHPSNADSVPEIQSQIRNQENKQPVVPEVIQENEIGAIQSVNEHDHPHANEVEEPEPQKESNDGALGDDDTIEIGPFVGQDTEVTTQAPSHDPAIYDDAVVILPDTSETQNVSEIKTETLSIGSETSNSPKEEDEVYDIPEQIHPDDQHADDQDQPIVATTEVSVLNDGADAVTFPSIKIATKYESDDEPKLSDAHPVTTITPIDNDEVSHDEPSHGEIKVEDDAPGVTTVSPVHHDEESQSETNSATTPGSVVEIGDKVIKSSQTSEVEPSVSSESKFRLDLTAFEESAESVEKQLTTQAPSKVLDEEVVFDEIQKSPTQVPTESEFRQDQPSEYTTTQRAEKLNRDDIEMTTALVVHESRDSVESFGQATTNNPARSDSASEDVATTSVPIASDDQAEEQDLTSTIKAPEYLRQDTAEVPTTASTPIEGNNERETNTVASDASSNDFVEVSTGAPSGFAAEYREETTIHDFITTVNPVSKSEIINDDTATEAPVFDEDVKSDIESGAQIATTYEPTIFRAKAETVVDEVTTTHSIIPEVINAEEDVVNDDSNDELAFTISLTTVPPAVNATEKLKTISIDKMMIPAEGVSAPAVSDDIVKTKYDSRSDIGEADSDSWIKQTSVKNRQLSGLFPLVRSRGQKRLVRQPRGTDAVLEGSLNQSQPHQTSKVPYKTYFNKTKKATEEITKLPVKKPYFATRSFIFF